MPVEYCFLSSSAMEDLQFEEQSLSCISSRNRKSTFSIDSILSQKLTGERNDDLKNEVFEWENPTSRYHDDKHRQQFLHKLDGGDEFLSKCNCDKCENNDIGGYAKAPPPAGSLHLLEGIDLENRTYSPSHYGRNSQDDLLNYSRYTKELDTRRFSKRRRTIFTSSQLERLEYEFQQQQYIVGQERRCLARQLGLNEIQVKVWFQNRRIKWRKFAHGTPMPDLSL